MKKKQSDNRQTKIGNYDWGLITVVATLLTFGLLMVFSASYAQALTGYDNPYRFITRQLLWLSIGIVGMVIVARIDYSVWERLSIPMMGFALVLPIGVVAFANPVNGSTRFFFGGSVQPSELAKVIIIMYVSAWLASKGARVRDVRVGLLPFGVLMGIVSVLIVMQPDISTSLLIVSTASIMLFIAGAKLNQLLVLVLIGTATFGTVIRYSSYARGRVERYVDAIQNPLHSSEYQVIHAIQALISGGVSGVGIGNSTAKLPGYLPLSWSDNIFAIIGEELGLLGALLIVLLFAIFTYRGLKIALNAPDNFGMLLATGITSLLILQAILNAAVVVAVAPPTGVTLPFVSYGGSSLVTTMGAVGILLSISRYSDHVVRNQSVPRNNAYARLNLGWRNGRTRVSRTGGRRSNTTSRTKRTGARTGQRSATAGGKNSGKGGKSTGRSGRQSSGRQRSATTQATRR